MFKIQELVDPFTYKQLGESAWSLMDKRLIETLNQLKTLYGYTMVINDWSWGGQFSMRGYRPALSNVGKPNGAHYKGMAADIDFYDANHQLINANTIRAKIMADINHFPYIHCLEIGINWVHLDVMSESDSPMKRAGCNDKQVMLVDTKNFVSWFKRPAVA